MTRAKAFIILMIIATSLCPSSTLALESLSQGQMKHTIAQAGISIAVSDMVVENHTANLAISNPDSPDQYISFQELHAITHVNSGTTDKNGDGQINPLTIDIGVLNNQVMFMADSPDLSLSTDMTIDNIDFCGTSIGSFSVEAMELSSFHLYMGPHAGTGINYEVGQRFSIEKLSYTYNTTDALTLSGITFSSFFSGTLEDPTTWVSHDGFQIGDIANNNPATLDITGDTQANWTMTDSDGDTYSISNPRNDSAYIVLNMPMSGSIRINNISNNTDYGTSSQVTTDLGLLAIDGINVQKLNIEIPGRGLGRP